MSNAFQNQIGVTTEERVVNAFNLGSDISTRNIGLLVARERGVPNRPILVNNLKEDKRIFGEHNRSMYSSYTVETLFNNTGGYSANVFQVRVVGSGTLPSKTIVKNASANTQSIVSATVQNASSTQGQKDEITVSNVEVGDKFTLQIAEIGYNYTYTTTTTNVSDVIDAIKNNLASAVPLGYTVNIVSGKLVILSPNNTVYTTTTSSVNDATSESIFEVVAGREGEEDVS